MLVPSRSRGRVRPYWLALLALGCSASEPTADVEAAPLSEVGKPVPDQSMSVTSEGTDAPRVAEAKAPVEPKQLQRPIPETDPAPIVIKEPDPIEYRISKQMLTIYAAPEVTAPVRGRIPIFEGFEVFAYVEGKGCDGKGWADIGSGGYACLEQSRPGKKAKAQMLPEDRDRGLPFFYAKVPTGQTAYKWKSEADYRAGKDPVETLEAGHDYAFKYRKRSGSELMLIDDKGRVVPQSMMHKYQPSRFAGQDLVAAPVPEGQIMAWAVTWPETPVFAGPKRTETPAATIGYQDVIYIDAEPAAPDWYRLADGSGYVPDSVIGRFVPPSPLEGAGPQEVWIDVELDEQVLTVMHGETAVFATLISSGHKGPTPKGIFRIHHKQAIGEMRSNPGDDDPYAVEGVPFVQYFVGGYALHTAYWHNRFGRPISHGCVNLSPADAKYVFEQTGPQLRPGWVEAYEHEARLGTSLRVRRGNRPIEDKRKPVEHLYLGG